MKTTSRFALAAGACLLLGAAMTPVKAADLGGGCCADLEERVAELEATTARKGNRVVSLQVYGQVNKALLIWDDGIQSDAYIVDSTLASSRFGLVGKAQIKPGWTAGYNIEFEINNARADLVTQGKGGNHPELNGGADANTFLLRQNYWFVDSDTLGRISVGHQSTASDGSSEVVLGNSMRNADPNIGSNMCIRVKGAPTCWMGGVLNTTKFDTAPGGGFLGRANDFTADRLMDVVRYDTPSIYGFILSASWGENDYADVALRFKKEFNGIRLAAAISYQWDSRAAAVWGASTDSEILAGSISAMHMPTGLYAAFSAGQKDFKDPVWSDQNFWYVQGGIEKKLLPYGSTTVYGEYGNYDGYFGLAGGGSQTTRWGFGMNQKIDAAAMDIYAHATFWSFDDNYAKAGNYKLEDLSTVLIGSRIQF